MADPNLQCQVANAMVATLSSIPDGTCISKIATDMADGMLFTAVEMAPRSKRPRGAQCWCGGPGVEAEMNAAWQQKEEAKRSMRITPQRQPSKSREGGWKTSSEGSEGCHAEIIMGLRAQTRNTRSRR